MKEKLLLAIILLGIVSFAYAEGGTCPPGYYPIGGQGASGCAPIPDSEEADEESSPPSVRWADRWGAIAIDNTSSEVGVITSMPSKSKAEKAALAQCRAKGSDACKVKLAYYNQCAAIVWGNTGYNTTHAATKERASEIGMQSCGAEDSNCRVFYADCSLPERIE